MKIRPVLLGAPIAAACVCGHAGADISIDGYDAAANDRFSDSPSFVLAGFDVSGVGQASTGRWVTAISRNVVITANHFQPSGDVFFYAGNDASQPPVVRTLTTNTLVPGTDLALRVLDAPLPSSIRHFPYATEPLSGPPPSSALFTSSAGIYRNLNAYIFGRSPAANPATSDQAVGRNRVTAYSENVPAFGRPDVDTLLFNEDPSQSSSYVLYEAFLIGGDSGGPTFVEIEGDLRLIGINAFTFGPGTFPLMGDGSGMSYTGNQAGFIADFIATNAPCVADLTTSNVNPGEPGYGEPDGSADGADLSFYVEAWLAGDASTADLTTVNVNPGEPGYAQPDGLVDGADLSFFVDAWLAGCS